MMRRHLHTPAPARARAFWAAVLAVLSLSGLISAPAAAQEKQLSTSLQVDGPGQVAVGEPIKITLTVTQAAGLAGYETALRFDTAAAEFAGLQQRQNDLQKLGRDIHPVVAIDLPGGVAFGFYSCPAADCTGLARTQKDAGARGDLRLATVILIANAPGTLEIALDSTKLVDAAGNPIAFSLPKPSITVQVGAPGEGAFYPAPGGLWTLSTGSPVPAASVRDLTGDRRVTRADATEAALEWIRSRQSAAPCGPGLTAGRDLNRDGCVDISDLQAAAAASLKGVALSPSTGAFSLMSTFTVTGTGDGSDANIGNGICATAFNVCSLRAAIQEANAHPGPDTINFNIGGGGVKTIQLQWTLPTLSDTSGPTTIDGYTQPGAAPNTDPLVSNAVIRIEVVGNGASKHDGFVITSPGNVVRGLAVYKMRRAFWIYGSGAHHNWITGSFIGTNAAGTYLAPLWAENAYGVQIEQGAAQNRIGGTAPAERNIISGNALSGVALYHEQTNANVIFNNIAGLRPDGTGRLTNLKHGLDLNFGAALNVLGGIGPGERNVTSGNEASGIEVSHTSATTQNQIVGNFIGTDVTGQAATAWSANDYTGITLEDGVSNNVVAHNVVGNNRTGGIQITEFTTQGNQIYNNWVGVAPNGNPIGNLDFGIRADGVGNVIGPNNIIAYNEYNGIVIRADGADFNRITRNTIYNNGALSIDLLPDWITLNDPGDADTGPNENLNFPVLDSATTTQVTGTACAGCVVEVYLADSGAGAYGEGQTFAGSVTADVSGNFTAPISGAVSGSWVTATATDSAGNTSEFSLNLQVP